MRRTTFELKPGQINAYVMPRVRQVHVGWLFCHTLTGVSTTHAQYYFFRKLSVLTGLYDQTSWWDEP